MKFFTMILFSMLGQLTYSQDLHFREIPPPPAEVNAKTVLSRAIQGLGFRYYWATEGLRTDDLAYKPGNDARSSLETLQHIYSLWAVIHNSIDAKPVVSGSDPAPEDFATLRRETLNKLFLATQLLEQTDLKAEDIRIVFENYGNEKNNFPVWNLINGPLEDAVWHVGQVVSFRRASGNPFDGKANVFTGKKRE